MSDNITISQLEDINLQTWNPVLIGQRYGWQLGVSGGYSRRGNSVFTHQYTGEDVEEDIEYCENIYALFHAKAKFRTTSETQPSALHSILTKEGYQKSGISFVKTLGLTTNPTDANLDFTCSSVFSEDWLKTYSEFNNVSSELYQSQRAILQSIPTQICYGRIANHAVGLAVKFKDYIAFYNIAVNPRSRGQGYGRAIMQSLIHWGQKQHASTGILCVDGSNTPAINLYTQLGFQKQYSYWYWST